MKKTFLIAAMICLLLIIGTGTSVFAQTTPDLTDYFVAVGRQVTGPHDTAGLRQLVNQGQLTRNSLVWKEGMSDWAVAETVEELIPLLPSLGPPPLPVSHSPPPIPGQATSAPGQAALAPGQVSQAPVQTPPSQAPQETAPPAERQNNRLFINAGVGFGLTGSYDMGIPPISANVDIKISNTLPITMGAMGIYSTWVWTPGFNIDINWTNIGIGARVMYHFNFAPNLNPYAGVTLGYVMQSMRANTGGYASANYVIYGVCMGFRLFFGGGPLGIYTEVGYSTLQFVSAGLTIRR